MAVLSINELFAALEGTGFYNVVLPFILVFSLIYGLLSNINVFGDDDRADKVNALVAVAISLYAVYAGILSGFMTVFAGPFALGLILVLALLIAASLAGVDDSKWVTRGMAAVAVGGTALLIWISGGVSAVFGTDNPLGVVPTVDVNWAPLIVLVAGVAAIAWLIGAGPFDSGGGGGGPQGPPGA